MSASERVASMSPDELIEVIEGMRRIRAHPDATRVQRIRWYLLEPVGWARVQWETRHYRQAR